MTFLGRICRQTDPPNFLLLFWYDIHGHENIQRVVNASSYVFLIVSLVRTLACKTLQVTPNISNSKYADDATLIAEEEVRRRLCPPIGQKPDSGQWSNYELPPGVHSLRLRAIYWNYFLVLSILATGHFNQNLCSMEFIVGIFFRPKWIICIF